MGYLHMMNCLHVGGIKVSAVADRSKKALNRAKSIGVHNLFSDYEELMRHSNSLDAVVISLPNFLHSKSIKLALEAGLDVFVEKPLAITPRECYEIVKEVEKSGRKLMVGHCMRFMEAVEKLRKSISRGYAGELEVITIEEVLNGPFSHGRIPVPVPEWWFNPDKTGGGALIDLGYHWIDLFRYFAGSQETRVLYSYLDHRLNLPVEDTAIAILESPSNHVTGMIHVGWYQKSVFPQYNFRLIVHGSAGYLSSEDLVPKNLYLHAAKEGTKNLLRRIVGKKIRPLSYTYYYEAYYKEIKHFFECLKKDLNPSVPAVEGLKTIELVHEAYKLAKRD